jgi:endonuclease YncB( thermonuclease family)
MGLLLLTAWRREEEFVVRKVLGGDTLLLEDGRRVRLIGVECMANASRDAGFEEPGGEPTLLHALARRAEAFSRRCVEGKKVRLDFDIMNAPQKHVDARGYTLAYVKFFCKKPPPELAQYWKKAGIDIRWRRKWISLNGLLVQCGLAMVRTREPFKYRSEFDKFEAHARDAGIGIWGPVNELAYVGQGQGGDS